MKRNWPKIRQIQKFIALIDFERVNVYSSSIAFYTFLSAFPAMSATISIYLMFSAQPPIDSGPDSWPLVKSLVPVEVSTIVGEQMTKLINNRALSLAGAFVSFFIGIWMANMAMKSLMRGLNYSFGIRRKRGVVSFYFYSFTFTMLFILIIALSSTILSFPHLLDYLNLPHQIFEILLIIFNVATVGLLLTFGLACVYKYIPPHGQKRKITSYFSGAALATLLSIVASLILSFYLTHFPNINRIYGAFSSVIIFLLWLQFMAFSILLGARYNYFREKIRLKKLAQSMTSP